MKKYRVIIPINSEIECEIEAKNEEKAITEAEEELRFKQDCSLQIIKNADWITEEAYAYEID